MWYNSSGTDTIKTLFSRFPQVNYYSYTYAKYIIILSSEVFTAKDFLFIAYWMQHSLLRSELFLQKSDIFHFQLEIPQLGHTLVYRILCICEHNAYCFFFRIQYINWKKHSYACSISCLTHQNFTHLVKPHLTADSYTMYPYGKAYFLPVNP